MPHHFFILDFFEFFISELKNKEKSENREKKGREKMGERKEREGNRGKEKSEKRYGGGLACLRLISVDLPWVRQLAPIGL